MRRRYEVILFLSTALLVTLPFFFQRGFLLLLDWVPVPGEPLTWARWKTVGFPFYLTFWLGNVIAGGLSQKLFVTAAFFLAGYGMYRVAPVRSVWARVMVGLLFQFNPFIYSRMLTGQVGNVIGFALLPWWLLAMGKFMNAPSVRRAAMLAFMSSLVTWWSPHIAVVLVAAVVLFGAAASVRMYQDRSFAWWRSFVNGVLATAVIATMLNAFWIVPVLIGRSSDDIVFVRSGITNQHIFNFFTRSDPQHGVLWNVAAMYGFWGDDEWQYVPQKAIVPYWSSLLWALLAVVAWGLTVAVMPQRGGVSEPHSLSLPLPEGGEEKEKDSFLRSRAAAIVMVLVGVLAFVAAVGVAHPWFKSGALWVYDHVPFARGLREPQKFVAIVVLVYAFFSARGIEDILARIERLRRARWWWFQLIAPGFFLLIPIAYSPGLLWGFRGQIQPRQYPQSWFAVDRFLAEDRDEFRVLFLPWHQYINLSFAGTIIANPGERFFRSKSVIAGDNMEFGSIYSTSTRPESKVVEAILRDPLRNSWEAAIELAQINMKYVMLLEESDYTNYQWIDEAGGFTEVFRGDRIRVYRNEIWGIREELRIED